MEFVVVGTLANRFKAKLLSLRALHDSIKQQPSGLSVKLGKSDLSTEKCGGIVGRD